MAALSKREIQNQTATPETVEQYCEAWRGAVTLRRLPAAAKLDLMARIVTMNEQADGPEKTRDNMTLALDLAAASIVDDDGPMFTADELADHLPAAMELCEPIMRLNRLLADQIQHDQAAAKKN